MMIARFLLVPAIIFVLSTASGAAPKTYDFDYNASSIEFVYEFSGEKVTGKFPVFSGELVLDFADVRNSKAVVQIDVRKALGGFIFATSALRGAKILHAKKWPYITFRSTSAKVSADGATMEGQITVRDVTRPIKFTVRFFQLQGHAPEDRDELAIELSGQINRHEFGASGYPEMVGDTLAIRIFATIKKRP